MVVAQILNLVQKYLDAKITDVKTHLGTSGDTTENATGTGLQRARYLTARTPNLTQTNKSTYGKSATTAGTGFGSWTELIASAPAQFDIVAVTVAANGSNDGAGLRWVEVEIATGGAGSESAKISVSCVLNYANQSPVVIPIGPGYRVSAGARVSAHARHGHTSNYAYNVGIIYRQ